MKCYRLDTDKALAGIPSALFPVGNAESDHGLIKQAAISLIIPQEIDRKLFREELDSYNTDCYQFGEVWLRKPRQKPKHKIDKILLLIDWADYWPDRNLGDQSTLVTWEGTQALYACPYAHTYIRNRTTGVIFTVTAKGILKKLPPSDYQELSTGLARARTMASIKNNNVLLDYLME